MRLYVENAFLFSYLSKYLKNKGFRLNRNIELIIRSDRKTDNRASITAAR